MFFESGKIEKIKILAFKDENYSIPVPDTTEFELLINPESLSQKFTLEYSNLNNKPSNGQNATYFRTPPQSFSLDVLLDATGVIKDAGLLSIAIANPFATQDNDVTPLIQKLKKYCYDILSDTHRPPFVKIIYGGVDIYKGALQSMDIDYKLFTAVGKPLRAMVKLHFISSISPTEAAAAKDEQSPDITHQKTFKSGTHFTLLSNDVYQDVNRYIDVAKANNMLTFRKIKTGTIIFFPPIEK